MLRLLNLALILFSTTAHGALILTNFQSASVYVVARTGNMEARALLSSRMIALNASNLFWYEGANVVRAEVPQSALDALRADRDVAQVLTQDQPLQPQPVPLPPPINLTNFAPQQAQTAFAPNPMLTQGPGIGMGGAGMAGMGMGGMGMGMTGMGGMAMLDSLAGSMANHLFNRTPSCKVSLAKQPATYPAAGGEGTISVNASGTCAWQAQSSVDWIQIDSGAGVSGTGVISYTILPGAKKSRSGAITITASQGGIPIRGNATHVVLQNGK